jgi:hypothetical protein
MSDAKRDRGAIRIAVKEQLDEVLGTEIVGAIQKSLDEKQATFQKSMQDILVQRLDKIEAECNKTLKDQDKRARAVQGFLVQSAVHDLNGFANNMHITMTAWEEVMLEKIGNKEELNKLVDEKKKEVEIRFRAEKEKKMAEDIASKKAAAEAAKPAAPAEGNPEKPEQGPPNAEQPAQPPGGEEKAAS